MTATKTFAPSTLMKLSIADLKSQASKMEIEFEATATKQTLTDLIIEKQKKNQVSTYKSTAKEDAKLLKPEVVKAFEERKNDPLVDKKPVNQIEEELKLIKPNVKEAFNAKKAALMDMGKDDMDIALAKGGKKTLVVSVEPNTSVVVREKAKDQKPKSTEKKTESNEPSKLNKVGTEFSFTGKAKDHHHKVVAITKDGKAECESLQNGKKWTTKFPLTHAKYSTKVIIHKVGK